MLPEICRIAVVEGKFELAWIAWRREAGNDIRVLAQYGEPMYLEVLGRSESIVSAADDPVALRHVRTVRIRS